MRTTEIQPAIIAISLPVLGVTDGTFFSDILTVMGEDDVSGLREIDESLVTALVFIVDTVTIDKVPNAPVLEVGDNVELFTGFGDMVDVG